MFWGSLLIDFGFTVLGGLIEVIQEFVISGGDKCFFEKSMGWFRIFIGDPYFLQGPMFGPRAIDRSAVCDGKALVQESNIWADRMKGSRK